jgi:hypothetical protein
VGDADEDAFLIHIVRVALVNAVFSHLRVQQVKLQVALMLAVSQVMLTIDTSVLFSGELVEMAMLKPGNPAFGDL